MIKYRNTKVRLPLGLAKSLDPYFEEDEEIVDIVVETLVPNFDFRWLLLTNFRIIHIRNVWFSYNFRDVRFEGIDMQFTQGIFYDSLRLKSITDDYTAHFYSLSRSRIKTFLSKTEKERDRYKYSKQKNETEQQHQIVEELIVEGELPIEQDQGHREKLEKAKKQTKSPKKILSKSSVPLDSEAALQVIGEIDELKYEGTITEKEYEEKKRETLGRLR